MSMWRSAATLKSPLAALVALVLILGAVVGGTLAYLAAHTDAIVNTFTAAKVTTEIEETFAGSVKIKREYEEHR